ncbi:hypothetical protein CO612_03980 [Lysobacteraceae bacterium NML71-0210]|nr:hypothetical protein CO612_03980 [Xanthomonadaceae bacterium NML71-0210]
MKTINDAKSLIERSNYIDALKIIEEKINSENKEERYSAHLMKGIIFESGNKDIEINLHKAKQSYKAASTIASHKSITPIIFLSRIMMKMKDGNGMIEQLQNIEKLSKSADIDIALANYHATFSKDISKEKKYYLRAALKGRFAGFFGLSRALRKEGKTIKAASLDTLRIIIGPVIALFLGKRASSSIF